MSRDLWLLREFGESLKPPAGRPPDDLRRRVLAATTTRPAVRRSRWFQAVRRSWLTAPASAAAAVVALALGVVGLPDSVAPHDPPPRAKVTQVQTATQVLRLAADHVAVTARSPGRPDQYIFTESVVISSAPNPSGWSQTSREPTLIREWRPVGGSGHGLTQERPLASPDAPWQSEPIPTCQAVQDAAHACIWVLGAGKPSKGLPTNASLMYEFLYRSTYDDISVADAASLGADALAFERAARALYLAQTSPAVQVAVFTAMTRIPGVSVRLGARDVTGRRGVALMHRGPISTTELVFDATSYKYLGMNLKTSPTSPNGQVDGAGDSVEGLMARQAIRRVAIVDHIGDLP